ncbi:hypothetical protein F4810DRAFT_190472 [Camillea tinctor]|nr:hypothetical protein F4810DRAFT_190472 [Camillea tinctor]
MALRPLTLPLSITRRIAPLSRPFSSSTVSHPSNQIQIYISRLTDPYLNLSIEHFLLQRTPPDSFVLLLYANRPCVVVGRNQNPWVEANLGLLRERGVLGRLRRDHFQNGGDGSGVGYGEGEENDILLVRRRSGGGAVFHDAGNANWSVICPPASFDRDAHAAMVVRALGSRLGVAGCRVNARHDIVMDIPSSPSSASPILPRSSSPPADAGGERESGEASQPFKISGSAYKLTRSRSLHHGTCLLSSPHLPLLGRVLRSPAAPYILARGVESVRSPVRNAGVGSLRAFEDAVVAEFGAMYRADQAGVKVQVLGGDGDGEEGVSEEAVRGIPEVRRGYEELVSPEWIYTQTPQFTFSTHPSASDPRPRPAAPFRMSMTVRHGKITEASLSSSSSPSSTNLDSEFSLLGKHLHLVRDWREYIPGARGEWLNGIFGGGGDDIGRDNTKS